MASNCIDVNDQTTINSLRVGSGNYTNANGEYNLNQVEVFRQEFADNLLIESQTNPIIIAQTRYGEEFYETISYLNNFLKDKDLTNYNSLSERLDNGLITALEFADFIYIFNLTPNGVIESRPNSLLYQLNRYYANDIKFGSLGGVCELFNGVFAKVDGFFNFIGEVGTLVVSALKFISKSKDLSSDDFVGDTAASIINTKLIKNILELIENEINNLFEVFSIMMDNFNIAEIIGDIEVRINNATIRSILKKKDEGCLLASEENKKNVINKIQGLFNYAVGLFENPGVAEIQFLITRFCALISNVKALFMDFKVPIDQFEFKYKRIANRLKTISNITSSTAISNGAIRFSPEARREQINKIELSWEGTGGVYYTPTGEEPINPPEPTIEEYSNLPSCSDVKSGTNPRIIVSGDWVTDFGMEGWTGLDFDLRVYLMRLQSKLNVRIEVMNGWISQQYNARIGGIPDSSHMSGKSVDIAVTGIDVDTISNIAFKSGFKFVKVYDTHIHLDTRPLIG